MNISKRIVICFIISLILHVAGGTVLYVSFKPQSPKPPELAPHPITEISNSTPADTQDFVITKTDNRSKEKSQPKIHTVKRGEGFWVIARKYDVTIEELLDYNKLSPNHTLQAGDQIEIPK